MEIIKMTPNQKERFGNKFRRSEDNLNSELKTFSSIIN